MKKLLIKVVFILIAIVFAISMIGCTYADDTTSSLDTDETITRSIEQYSSSIPNEEESSTEDILSSSESTPDTLEENTTQIESVNEAKEFVEEATVSQDLSEEDISQMVEEVEGPTYEDEEPPVSRSNENARGLTLSDDEMWELVRIIYLENGRCYPNCTYLSVKYTADVLLNRLQQWGYADAYEVIWAPGQYSTANDYSDCGSYAEGWEISWTALYDALDNPDYTPVFQAQFAQGNPYYTDPITGEKFGY